MKNKKITTALKITVTCIALYFVFQKVDISDIAQLYSTSNVFYLLLALFLFISSKLISAFRFNTLLQAIEIDLSHIKNIKLYLLGMFYNLFLPGGIGGDGYKVYLLNKKYKVGVKKIIGTALIDRIAGVSALGILLLVLSRFIPEVIIYQKLLIFSAPLVWIAFYLFLKWLYKYFVKIHILILLQSFAVQLLQCVCAYFIVKSFGIETAFLTLVFLFLVSSVVAILPITPGGFGTREVVLLYGAKLFLLPESISVGLSIMFSFFTAFVSFWGIIYSVKKIEI